MPLRESKLVIGIPTVHRPRNYLLDTITRVVSGMPASVDRVEVVVFNADAVPERHTQFHALAKRYAALVNIGTLTLITPTTPQRPFASSTVAAERRRTLGDEYWMWEAKLVLDAAQLMEECRHRGDYYLHLEDDVIAVDHFYDRLIEWFDNRFSRRDDWTALCLAPPGRLDDGAPLPLQMLNSTAALMFRARELDRLVPYFREIHGQLPLDRGLAQWLEARGATMLVSTPALVQHIGRLSSRTGVFRDHESATFPESRFARSRRHVRELRDVLITSPHLFWRLLRMRRLLSESVWIFLQRLRGFRRS